MSPPRLIRADFGSDLAVREKYSFQEKLTGYLTLARPMFLIMTPLNAASAAVLSIRGLPSWNLCVAGFFTGAFAAAGVNIFNRFADAERDKILWPLRSIPSGRVKANQALALSIIAYIVALSLCLVYFNITAFLLLFAAIILGSSYSSFLRDRIGYFSLPLIEGLIFLTGWASLSPGTVFTSVTSWYLYLLGVVWQSAHIMAHYALNVRHDSSGKEMTQAGVLFSKPSIIIASRVTLGLTILLFVLRSLLPLLTPLSLLYIIPVGAFGIYTIYQCRAFLHTSMDREKMHGAWSSLSLFRMIISLTLILSILISL